MRHSLLRHELARILHRLGAFIILLVSTVPSSADVVSFQANVNGQNTVAVLDEVVLDGIDYVSLQQLVEQLGGGLTLLPTRVQVDFMSSTAWLRIDGREVNAALSRFSLGQPVRRENGEIFIAKADVRPLFSRAFRLTVSPATEASRPAPVRRAPSERVVVEDLGALDSNLASFRFASVPPELRRPIRRVVIDAGHGGLDTGAEGRDGLVEKELALAVATRLKSFIENTAGVEAVLTRTSDEGMEIKDRIGAVERANGDLVLSLHAGASLSDAVSGFEIFHAPIRDEAQSMIRERGVWSTLTDSGRAAAQQSLEIATWMGRALEDELAAQYRGARPGNLRLFANLEVPGLHFELGYLTNAADEARLGTEAYQTKVARAIASGLRAYIASTRNEAP